MRILVISDTHGDFFALNDAVKKHSNAEIVFFLGDGYKELCDVEALYPEKKFLAVKGNCDFFCPLPAVDIISTEFGKIMFTHGDVFDVKSTMVNIKRTAQQNDVRLVLFGHTHKKYMEYDDGIYYFNPGSLGRAGEEGKSYGVCDVLKSGIMTNFIKTL